MPEFFPQISRIEYAGPDSRDAFTFKHYNAVETVGDKTMAEHLRFSVAYWHTFCGVGVDPFGVGTAVRPWNEGDSPMKAAEKKLQAAFELFTKLGVPYYCFHDRDIAPEGRNLAETNANLEKICRQALQMQKDTGVKLLWGHPNVGERW